MNKYWIALVVTFLCSGCAAIDYQHVSNEKDIWIQRHRSSYDNVLYYCRGNPDADGSSTPICVEAIKLPPNPKVRSIGETPPGRPPMTSPKSIKDSSRDTVDIDPPTEEEIRKSTHKQKQ